MCEGFCIVLFSLKIITQILKMVQIKSISGNGTDMGICKDPFLSFDVMLMLLPMAQRHDSRI